MVKKLFICSAAVLMMVACGNKTAQCCGNDTTATAGIAAAEVSEDAHMDSLKTDTVSFDKQALKEELVSFSGSIDELPLPDFEPYLTEQGVTFIYQPYEISYYAAGKPEFTIPYNVVKPYLKAQAIELF